MANKGLVGRVALAGLVETMARSRWTRVAALIVAVAVVGSGSIVLANDEISQVRLMVGRSTVVNVDAPISRVSLTSSDIADAMVTTPNQLLVQGKVPGTISMFVWDRAGGMRRYDVTVERDLTKLSQQVRDLFPGESISVEGNGKSVVVAGTVSSKYVADKAIEVAAGYVEKKDDVVSLLQVRETAPPQVLLRVRFAEVSRSALTELGASLFTGPGGYKDYVGRSSTQQFPAPDFDDKGDGTSLVFSDFLNLFFFDLKNNVGAVVKALQTRGLFQSLAEPNLVAESGKEASFLAGGEFPIPVAQSTGSTIAITVVFKEFGIRLNFTPTVNGGDRVRLKVRPEVSTLDFSNAIVLQGFRIPALSTRRTETEIELQNGQTFAIAGLLNNTATQSLQKVPGIGDIPILGLLFRSKAAQKQQTELVVMITPQILPRGSSGVTDQLPRQVEPYMPPPAPNRSFPPPPPAFTTPRPGGGDAAAAPVVSVLPARPATPTPAEAAAAVLKANEPKAPTLRSLPATGAAPNAAAAVGTPGAAPAPTAPASGDASSSHVAAAPAAPAGASAAPPAPPREPTREEKRRMEEEKKQMDKAMKAVAEREAKEAELEKKRQEDEARKQQQAAREQAKREKEAADRAAKDSARQAEIDKKQQKAIEEAAAKLKAAETAYQSEVAKKSGSSSKQQ